MSMNPKTPTGRNLRKIFALVPLIHGRSGITIDELRRASGYESERELRRALDRLMMFGVPPFSPADFISIYIDDEQRVFLDFPQGLERPLALTGPEWTAVQALIQSELNFQTGEGSLASDLEEVLKKLSSIPVETETADFSRSKRALVQEALDDHLQIQFGYRTLSSKEAEQRRVDPWVLFQNRGVSYLLAYCHTRQAPRSFHLERMQDVELLEAEQESEPPADLKETLAHSPIFQQGIGFSVSLAFAPELRALLESAFQIFDVEPAGLPEMERAHWMRGSCKVQESLWFREALRGMGPEVEILEPLHLRERYLEDLQAISVPEPI